MYSKINKLFDFLLIKDINRDQINSYKFIKKFIRENNLFKEKKYSRNIIKKLNNNEKIILYIILKLHNKNLKLIDLNYLLYNLELKNVDILGKRLTDLKFIHKEQGPLCDELINIMKKIAVPNKGKNFTLNSTYKIKKEILEYIIINNIIDNILLKVKPSLEKINFKDKEKLIEKFSKILLKSTNQKKELLNIIKEN